MQAITRDSYIQDIKDSRLMSTELADIGYSDRYRKKQRELILILSECHNIIQSVLNNGNKISAFTVGSKIEGTSLKDSDYDILFGPSAEYVAAICSPNEELEGRLNILIVKNDISPPGHAWLKLLKNPTLPISVTKIDCLENEELCRILIQNELFGQIYVSLEGVPDVDQQLLFTWPGTLFIDDIDLMFYIPNSLFTLIGSQLWASKASRSGPSFSDSDTDLVRAIFCDNVYPRDQDPITIGGNLYGNLQVPKEHPCNFVPVGHPESKDAMLEWRISYNLTERDIILGLNTTQIHTYVVLKMLQRSCFKHFSGNTFTSYHCKTSLYHTIASNVTTIWMEDNLINCVRQCLKIIRMFLKKKFCPHFFNKAFNIFSGKLPRCGEHWSTLIALVDCLVDDPKIYFQCLEEEQIKLNRTPGLPIETEDFVLRCITLVEQLNKHIVHPYIPFESCASIIRLDDIRKTRMMYKTLQKNIGYQIERASSGQRKECADVVLSLVKVRHYLLSAAYLLEQGKPLKNTLPNNILPDALSQDLQMSSLLFVCKKYDQCRLCLDRVFLKIATDPMFFVQFVNRGRCLLRIDMEVFLKRYNGPLPITNISAWTFIKRHVSLQVIFLVHELRLLHPLLRFEAYRFLFEDRRNMCRVDDEWFCVVRLDSIPFLFFMQYLVYKELGLEEQKYEALVRLELCIDYSSMSDRHIAMNMFGICCELEWNYIKAVHYYARSLKMQPRFNAAKCHIALLVWKIWVKHNVELVQAGILQSVLSNVD
ncbi:uncharacterized protein LOC128236766 isoform X1 [Mya arenaria]|uniref:uncharacterized protein LOC128236766 isoform X1 n=1 Tax=Mya arenaria TaxID=6604 RepID=UPI0022DFB8A9|nr:uncharacterized protein LOC128236766 isoform X1 [Mya arenaria]XP_052807830.1 uncharacterized protein LOC128236766 isoform X1 [Mya arenaria]XP_052807831.1 uncharacterized protein LOC128236766 isoform X1 [Mya arenaria]XP_052807833.1 uncharacterized protein LOC128236766 isoform X1 [Mya arenaria]XP_052807834.1 uncharacterized protein LOC128236766 isoform X1 [Mya arenaria]XP_052807835.1 uncharacterized protein LOC128236766 isoform X1 [Mya arenaria]XP_052807836.1 uncharacterized protein LOC12823